MRRWFYLLVIAAMLLSKPALASREIAASGIEPANGRVASADVELLAADDRGILIAVDTSAYLVTRNALDGRAADQIQVDGASFTSEAGYPQLPMVGVLVGVPPGVEIDLQATLLDTTTLDGAFDLQPAPQPAPLTGEIKGGEMQYARDEDAYRRTDLYPQQSARLAQVAWMRNQRIARLEVYPFQVTPASGRLLWHRRILVELRFAPTPGSTGEELPVSQTGPLQDDSPFETVLRGALLNYDQARSWRSSAPISSAQFPSLLANTTAYRIPIRHDGLYRLTYSALQAAGLDVDHLDPNNFHLTSQGEPVAYYLYNKNPGDPGVFEPGEYLAFYGQKFYGERLAGLYQDEDDQWLNFSTQDISGTYTTWRPQITAAQMEKYTDENVYWLHVDNVPGLKMNQVNGFPGSAPIAQSYRTTAAAGEDVWRVANQSWTLLQGVENWFWSQNRTVNPLGTTWSYTTTLSAPAAGTYTATIRAEIASITGNDLSSPDHRTAFYLNDGAHLQPIDDRTWDGKSRYSFEAAVPQSSLNDGVNQLDLVAYLLPGMSSDELYFDGFEIEYQRNFLAQEDGIEFAAPNTGTWRYQIGGFVAQELAVLDLTVPAQPIWVTGALRNFDVLDFQVSHLEGARYYAGKFLDIPAAGITAYTPPSFDNPADYLIITHADFIAASQALASYRQSQGLSTLVVDVADLYNQFNYGIYNPIAIKNFLAYTFQQWADPPQYAVLVGDGDWNFKGSPRYNHPPIYMPPNLAWIDPWYGELDSANLLATVVGDDPLPDLVISRMPVNSSAELEAIIEKTIAYEATPPQDWQHRLFFAADIPDTAGDFNKISDAVIADYVEPGFAADRAYETDLGCQQYTVCPQAKYAITHTLNTTGTLLLSYTGHASINRWSGEKILENQDLAWLDNGDRLPVVLSMTCLDGFWIHPGIVPAPLQSMMEEMLRAGGKGMAASFSPTGYGVASGHDELQRGFLDAIFRQGSWNLGTATISGKLRLFTSGRDFDLLHTFTIFGDPALRLPSPYDLELSPASDEQSGPPGATLTYTLQLTNTGSITDTFEIGVQGNTWQVTTPLSVTLPGGASYFIPIQVTVPLNAGGAQSDAGSVIVSSNGDIGKVRTSLLTSSLSWLRVYLPEIEN